MTYTTYTTYKTYTKPSFGYEKLTIYWLACTISDLNFIFLGRYIDKFSRTFDQMTQAERSGKQNLVEGSLQFSKEGLLKLSDVGRASYGELLEDYKDYLRHHELPAWDKNDPRILEIRQTADLPYKSYKTYKSYTTYTNSPEGFTNLMITLLYKQLYLMSRYLAANKEIFIKEGGFRENLLKSRLDYKKGGK